MDELQEKITIEIPETAFIELILGYVREKMEINIEDPEIEIRYSKGLNNPGNMIVSVHGKAIKRNL